ncbi:MAG: alginate export family protein, partial [Methylococcales bacterium]|nr:alginate export family protein [Methylococcales bacterium]
SVQADDTTPWRIGKALDLPDWLQIITEHRIRYESLDQQFRAKTNGIKALGGDQALVFRSLLHLKIDLDFIRVGAEMMDSRIKLDDIGTASSSGQLSNSIANALELLQAYIEVPVADLFIKGSQSTLRGGRMTMDVGSRRLVARNRFRNTINAFTGLDWQWQLEHKKIRAFYTLPIQRLNSGYIGNNRQKFDREHTNVRFWGLYYSQPTFSALDQGEAFVFGLNENDTSGRKTKDRNLYTLGFRLWRTPSIGQFDYQLEAAYQFGTSRSSKKSTEDLAHWAHFHHGEIGYSFDALLSPRLFIQYDYASGDKDPNDSKNNRFETLYGARRFDFGPTSIYAPFARGNLSSPALRLNLKPFNNFATMFSLRGFWLASVNDQWTGAAINGTNSYIGTQIEARLRWDILPKNVRLEGGVAHIFAGNLMENADKKDSTYVYSQMVLKF